MLHVITYRMLKAEKVNVVALLECAEDFRSTMERKIGQKVKMGTEKKDGTLKLSWNRVDKAKGSFTNETDEKTRQAVRLMAFDSAIAEAAHAAGDFGLQGLPDWCKGLAKFFPVKVEEPKSETKSETKPETESAAK